MSKKLVLQLLIVSALIGTQINAVTYSLYQTPNSSVTGILNTTSNTLQYCNMPTSAAAMMQGVTLMNLPSKQFTSVASGSTYQIGTQSQFGAQPGIGGSSTSPYEINIPQGTIVVIS